jgi:hypothetical protein
MRIASLHPISTTPPSNVSKKRDGDSGKQLTAIYRREGISYEIDCYYSPCKSKCHFSNSEVGETIFDKETQTFIAATRLIEEDYLKYLHRTIKVWQRHFSGF